MACSIDIAYLLALDSPHFFLVRTVSAALDRGDLADTLSPDGTSTFVCCLAVASHCPPTECRASDRPTVQWVPFGDVAEIHSYDR